MSRRQQRARHRRRLTHHAGRRIALAGGSASVVAVAGLLSGSVAHAAGTTVTVDSAGGGAAAANAATVVQGSGLETLADAIDYLDNNGGGQITFASTLSGDTIAVTTALPDITQSMNIEGLGASQLTLSGQGASMTLLNDTVANAGLLVSGLTLEDVEDTTATAGLISSDAPVGVVDSVLTGVSADSSSSNNSVAFIITGNSSVALTGDTVDGNDPSYNGITSNASSGTGLSITDSTIENNLATGGYGLLSAENAGGVLISGSVVSGNQNVYGGIVYSPHGTPVTVEQSTFSGNSDASLGMIFTYGDLSVVGSTIADNTSNDGALSGDGRSSQNSVSVINSTLTGNTDTVYGNSDQAGAIRLYDEHSFTAIGDTIDDNSTVEATQGDTASGGGISVAGQNATAVSLEDTVVAQNTAGSEPDLNLTTSGTATAEYSLIGVGDPADVGSGTLTVDRTDRTGTAASPLNPDLAALADNGGLSTPAGVIETQLPETGSPLINAGDAAEFSSSATPFNTDERGDSRPVVYPGVPVTGGGDGADIGAVELQIPPTATPPTSTPSPTTPTTTTPTTSAPTPATPAPTPTSVVPAAPITFAPSIPTPAPTAIGRLTVAAVKVGASSVRLKLACGTASCTGHVELTTVEHLSGTKPVGVSSLRRRTVTVDVGELSYSLRSGGSRVDTVKLNATGRRLLSRFRKLPVAVLVSQKGHQPAIISARHLTLQAPVSVHRRSTAGLSRSGRS